MKIKIEKFITFYKYGIVGVFVTFIDVCLLYLLRHFLYIDVLVASVISFVVANITSFILNKLWTFQNRNRYVIRQYIKFLIISIIGLFLTVFFMWIFYIKMNLFINISGNNYLFCKLLTSVIVMIWNFLGNKFWTFSSALGLFYNDLKITKRKYKYFLSVVIPAYNENKRIVNTVESILKYLRKKSFKWEIIIVDDGSSDGTYETLKENYYKNKSIKIIHNPVNHGKGYSVKMGVLNSNGKYVLFTDADNSTPIEELEKFLPNFYDNMVLIGSRYKKDKYTVIKKQPAYRIIISRIGNYLVKLFLLLDIEDTQCGFKLFPANVAYYIFKLQTVNRFGFDMEILILAKLFNLKIKEISVNWFNSDFSRVRPVKDAFVTFMDLIRIKINMWNNYYKNKFDALLGEYNDK